MSFHESGQVWTVTFDLNMCKMRLDKEIFESSYKNWVYPDTCDRGQKKASNFKCFNVSHYGIPTISLVLRIFYNIIKFQKL